jgi:hypothetical protein
MVVFLSTVGDNPLNAYDRDDAPLLRAEKGGILMPAGYLAIGVNCLSVLRISAVTTGMGHRTIE